MDRGKKIEIGAFGAVGCSSSNAHESIELPWRCVEMEAPKAATGVVIIGRNEGERLAACLRSLGSSGVRLVYVDSGSIDDSVELARKCGADVVQLNSKARFTAARARNEGFQLLKSLEPNLEFVQFVDGDCEVAEGWMNAAVSFLIANPDVAVVCGRRREKHPDKSLYNMMMDIEWDTPIGEALASGGDSLVRSSAFEMVGGFRPDLMAGEEPELCSRLRQQGWRIFRIDAEMTRHDAAMTCFAQFWRRAVRFGYGAAEIAVLHRAARLARVESKQAVRAAIWGGAIPICLLGGLFLSPWVLLGALIYPIQVCRIAFRRGAARSESWLYALLIMVSKFAEFRGAIQFVCAMCWKNEARPIEYKAIR